MNASVQPRLAFVSAPSSDSLPDRTYSLFGKDQYVNDDITHAQSIEDPTSRAASERFFAPDNDTLPVYANVLPALDTQRVDKTSYIKAWLLHRVQTLPFEMGQLTHAQKAAGADVNQADNNDHSFVLDYRDTELPGAIAKPDATSHKVSVATNNGRDLGSKPASDSSFPIEERKQHLEL
jgi:hypothetical protein